MTRRRRGAGPTRRARSQAERIGQEIRIARSRLAFTRQQVADKSGTSRGTVERTELGFPGVQLDTLCAVASTVGLDIVVRAFPSSEPSLRDTGQLELAEQLRAEASPKLKVTLEDVAGSTGEAADEVFYGPDEIVHAEIERLMVDFQAQYRAASHKRDYLAQHHARPVRLVLVVEDTDRNRRALAPHLGLIRTNLPADSREVLRALRSGMPLGRDGLVWIRRRRRRRVSRARHSGRGQVRA